MKTVRIDLDQKLLAAAAAIMGTSTSNATINEALRRIVVHERQLHHLERLASGVLALSSDLHAVASECALPGPEVITADG
ncbi:type II toxin-antitoxin system VapB family antitoxin [Nocardia nepalensis]|uniref:type II toxin-antitoxin system VapB family antitoxin n=1 Tax=Nocardia nepalensis TaxID=3375448 RepID=UPI003B66FEF2